MLIEQMATLFILAVPPKQISRASAVVIFTLYFSFSSVVSCTASTYENAARTFHDFDMLELLENKTVQVACLQNQETGHFFS